MLSSDNTRPIRDSVTVCKYHSNGENFGRKYFNKNAPRKITNMDGTEKNDLMLNARVDELLPKSKENVLTQFVWKDFSSYCTLHGLHFVFEGRPKLQRFIWLLLLLLMFTLFVWQTSTLVILFFNFKVTSTVQLINERSSVFPAVTICNFNRYRRNLTNKDFQKVVRIKNPLYKDNPEEMNYTLYNILNKISMEDIVRSGGHQMEYNKTTNGGMLYRCVWKGSLCGVQNFTPIFTDMGICYTFNSGKNGIRLTTNSPGNRFGLKLTMSVEQEYYIGYDAFSAGLRIRVHDQGEPPLVRELGFAVMPGAHVFASLTRKRLISLEAPYETNCQNKKLPGIVSYSLAGCHDACKEIFLTKNCSCRAFYMRDRSHPLCTVEQYFDCIVPKEEEFSTISLDSCNCSEPCNVIKYNAYLSYGRFPSNDASKLYANGSEERNEQYKDNLVRIDIFYEDLYYNVIEQVPAYSLQNLLGEIGGLLGLFLGASTLTLVEFFDLGIVYALTRVGIFKPYRVRR